MTRRKLTDAEIITGIREATAAWQAPQDTDYYAERFGVLPATMRAYLLRLADAGAVEHYRARTYARFVDTWIAKESQP